MTFLIVCVSVFIGIIIGVAQVMRIKEIMENYSTVTSKTKKSQEVEVNVFHINETVMVELENKVFIGSIVAIKQDFLVLLIKTPNHNSKLIVVRSEDVFKTEE